MAAVTSVAQSSRAFSQGECCKQLVTASLDKYHQRCLFSIVNLVPFLV